MLKALLRFIVSLIVLAIILALCVRLGVLTSEDIANVVNLVITGINIALDKTAQFVEETIV